MVKVHGIERNAPPFLARAGPRAMNAKLLVVTGKTTKREVELQLPAVLGRSREADVTVAHPLISRRHCEISENDGLLMLRDLASLNGTMIGGRRVELVPLLPDAEFTIGPLTFRVLYQYDGDPDLVPAGRFVDAVQGPAEAGVVDLVSAGAEEVPMFEVDEALPAESAGASDSDELAAPGFVAEPDEEPEEALPAEESPLMLQPPAASDVLATMPATGALDDPLEVDSSLQSGGHGKASPWAVEPRPMEKPREAPPDSAETGPPAQPETASEATSAEEVAKPEPKPKPAAARRPKRPTDSDEMDPEFGSFFEGLQ